MSKVLIAMPSTGLIPMFTVHAMLAMRSTYPAEWYLIGHSLVYDAREMAIKQMKSGDFSHIFFMDSDMTPPPDIITKLIAHDKDIVSGIAFKRFAPYEPCFFKSITEDKAEHYFDYPENELLEVEGVGMACCLIKREVFDKLEEPYFFPKEGIGEDLAFCVRAKEAGFKMYVDTSIVVGHVTNAIITDQHFKTHREKVKRLDSRHDVSQK